MSDHSSSELRNRGLTISYSSFIAFLAGIVIPLVAAALPLVVDFFRTKDAFIYFRDEPVFFQKRVAYTVQVWNQGKSVEKNVEAWFQVPSDGDLVVEVGPLAEDIPDIRIRSEGKYKVAALGHMRPGEKYQLSILKSWDRLGYDKDEGVWSYPAFVDKVVSAEGKAKHLPREGSFWAGARRSVGWYGTTLTFFLALAAMLFAIQMRRRNSQTDSSEISEGSGETK